MAFHRSIARFCCFFAAFLLLAACGKEETPAPKEPAKEPEKKAAEEPAAEPEPGGEAEEPVSLAKDVVPLFVRSCGACHRREGGAPPAVKNQVYYEKKEDVLARLGKHIIAGKPQESGLLGVLRQETKVGENKIAMPPPGAGIQAWSKEEVELLARWIREGAADN